MPHGLPLLPEVALAAHCVVDGEELAAGGGWCDAVPLADGRLAVAVGDLVDGGPPAAVSAAAVAHLRSAAVGVFELGNDLRITASLLDTFAARSQATMAATVCLVLIEPRTGRIEVVSHAHPPPLVLPAAGGSRFLDVAITGPLGVGAPRPAVHVDRLEPDDLMLLYSAEVLGGAFEPERRAELAAAAEAARSRAESAAATTPGRLPDRVCMFAAAAMSGRARAGRPEGTTLLAVQRRRRPLLPLALVIQQAAPDALRAVRDAVAAWLNRLDATPADVHALVHAVGEATTNVIEHAYAGAEPGSLTVLAALTRQGSVRIAIADEGTWREHPALAGGRGRGLAMMRGLADRVEVVRATTGTMIVLHHPLRHPVTWAPAA